MFPPLHFSQLDLPFTVLLKALLELFLFASDYLLMYQIGARFVWRAECTEFGFWRGILNLPRPLNLQHSGEDQWDSRGSSLKDQPARLWNLPQI